MGKQWKQWETLFWGAPKSLQRGWLWRCTSVGSCNGAQKQLRGATPYPRSGAEAGRTPCQEELPHVWGQGRRMRVPGCDSAGAATPLPRSGWQPRRATPPRGQGRRPGGATQRPRSSGYAGTRGPRGVIPRSRSGGVAVRRYPSSKVRSSNCTLLEQPWRNTPWPR